MIHLNGSASACKLVLFHTGFGSREHIRRAQKQVRLGKWCMLAKVDTYRTRKQSCKENRPQGWGSAWTVGGERHHVICVTVTVIIESTQRDNESLGPQQRALFGPLCGQSASTTQGSRLESTFYDFESCFGWEFQASSNIFLSTHTCTH